MDEEKKPNEFTKDEIFNMSDEEFEKNFNSLPKDSSTFSSFFEPSNSDEGNQNVDNNNGESKVFDKPKVDDSKQNADKGIDNNKNFWNNFNSVNQDEPPTDTDSEGDNNQSDNNTQSDDDDKVDEPSDDEPKNQPQVHKVKAYGQTMNFTTDELIKLAPKALHFTKKLQELAPFRRSISAMQENKITEDDLNQFIEMKKGNKTAIANFLNKSNVDAYELTAIDDNDTREYQPSKYGREQNALTQTIDELAHHPKVAELHRYVDSLDGESRKRLANNPDVLEVLMSNIENGYFDIIAPEANKRAFLDGNRKPAIEYYADVAKEYYDYLDSKERAKKQNTFNRDMDKARNKAKITGDTGIRTQQKQPKQITSAYDISDEELEAFEKQMGFLT